MLQELIFRLFKVSWKHKSLVLRRESRMKSTSFFFLPEVTISSSNLGSCFVIYSRNEDWIRGSVVLRIFKLLSTIWTGKLQSKRSGEQKISWSDRIHWNRSTAPHCKICQFLKTDVGILIAISCNTCSRISNHTENERFRALFGAQTIDTS